MPVEKEIYPQGVTSGRDEVQVEQIESDIIVSLTGKIGQDSIRVPGPCFKFMCVVCFLLKHPNWFKGVGDSSMETALGFKEVEEEDGKEGDSVMRENIFSRPIWMRRKKEV